MRFLSFTPRTLSVSLALALLASAGQAQTLRAPGTPGAAGSAQSQLGGSSVSRALNATSKPSAPAAPANAARSGLRSADYIVAVVNSEPVTNNEVRARMQRVAANIASQGGQMPPEGVLAREVLERLIVEKVQLQEAQDTGIRTDETAVDLAINNVARQNGLDKAGLLAHLRAEGMDEKRFRAEISNQMLLQRVRERDVDSKVKVTDADIDRYLKEQNSSPEQAPGMMAVNLGHILITVPEGASPAVVAEREARAQKAAEAARAGGDFDAVVKEYSDVPLGKGGGAMGTRPLGEYPDLFAQAAATASTGSILGPLRSGAGFHVLKVIEKSQGGAQAVVSQNHGRHILLRTGDGMTEAQAIKRLADYKRRVESGQASFESLAREYSQDGSARQGGDLGWASPGQFVPEFESTLNALKPGEISDPVVSRFGVHLIQLVERRQATLTQREQRDMVRNVVRENKVETEFESWLRELRGKAYVEYREPPQ